MVDNEDNDEIDQDTLHAFKRFESALDSYMMYDKEVIHWLSVLPKNVSKAVDNLMPELEQSEAFNKLISVLIKNGLALNIDSIKDYNAMIGQLPLAGCDGCEYHCRIQTTAEREATGIFIDLLDPEDNGGGLHVPGDYCPFGGKGGNWKTWSVVEQYPDEYKDEI